MLLLANWSKESRGQAPRDYSKGSVELPGGSTDGDTGALLHVHSVLLILRVSQKGKKLAIHVPQSLRLTDLMQTQK